MTTRDQPNLTRNRKGGRLTPRQARFVTEYLVDLNATQAARRAGYRGSDLVLAPAASRLLRRPAVAAAVKAGTTARAHRASVEADQVVRELARIAFSNVCDFFDENWRPQPLPKLSEDTRRALASLDVEVSGECGTTTKIRLWDKVRALELLGRHLGMFKDKVQLEAGATLEQLLRAATAPE